MEFDLTNPSFKNFSKLCMPLMLAFLSSLGMFFIDRLFITNYSLDALAAVVSGGTIAWGLMLLTMNTTICSEVLVARYNGARRYSEIGRPVWQMVWFSLFMAIPYAIGAFTLPSLFFGSGEEVSVHTRYFQWTMVMGPLSGINASLMGFYIGQGKGSVVKNAVILGNILNLVLDPLMIFGYGPFPEMGAEGAAIATIIGTLGSTSILFWGFYFHPEGIKKGSKNYQLSWPLLKESLYVGIPSGLSRGIEVMAWGVFYIMVEKAGGVHITVAGFSQNLLGLFLFFTMALEKGVITFAGNLMGANKHHLLPKLLRSAFTLVLIYGLILGILLIGMPNLFISMFFTAEQVAELGIERYLHFALLICTFYLVLEAANWALKGVLIAAKKTLFILFSGVISVWAFMVAPVYFLIYSLNYETENIYYVTVAFSALSLLILALKTLHYFKASRREVVLS